MSEIRSELKNCKRIVVKAGSSSLVHPETGKLDLVKVERLIRILSDFKNQGKDVILVSSGAIAVGCDVLGLSRRPEILPMKQACAAIGQGELMMLYQKIFQEYNHKAAQVLLTFGTVTRTGTGGMYTKIAAAEIATHAGAHVAILESTDLTLVQTLIEGEDVGTLFVEQKNRKFDLLGYIVNKEYLNQE